MPYRSTENTRRKKDAKRTAMMQAAVRVFAQKGYHAATVRDIVAEADVAIGTFYFYFPDKETLFNHLFEETATFMLQTLEQALNSRTTFAAKLEAAVQAYVNIAFYEPAVVQLLLIGGVGSVPALVERRSGYREKLIRTWQRTLATALEHQEIMPQNVRRTAEGLAGGFDEIMLNLLSLPGKEHEGQEAISDMIQFGLRASGYIYA
ncbi:MAG: TetR/AcrR family transcriptional regulator [Anaerolineae bacterium]|nr:TetR/AcrR family transcriptional regulator [Promineifilum sp.]MCZ2114356.1 TetR/AcrR family transcriptional regulator [Anaerolineae bacterium]HNS38789.1 TetR/AcrR family transcriptional regulator [Promineifilum sp.]